MVKSEEDLKMLPKFLKQAIDSKMKEVVDEEMKLMHERIDERKDHIIAGVILHVEKMMNVERFGEELIITIKSE